MFTLLILSYNLEFKKSKMADKRYFKIKTLPYLSNAHVTLCKIYFVD